MCLVLCGMPNKKRWIISAHGRLIGLSAYSPHHWRHNVGVCGVFQPPPPTALYVSIWLRAIASIPGAGMVGGDGEHH